LAGERLENNNETKNEFFNCREDSESEEKGRGTDLQMHIHVHIVASSSIAIQKMEKGHAQRRLHCRSLEALSTIDTARAIATDGNVLPWASSR
jgi:hypothetical protein